MTVSGEADNPAAAMANAVWGMREAIALSGTALKKAEGLHAPLELAGDDPVQQEPVGGSAARRPRRLGLQDKDCAPGDNDYLHFEALEDRGR